MRVQEGRTAVAFQLADLELLEGWAEEDPARRGKFAFPITAATGAASTSLGYLELPRGPMVGRTHTHTAEEILLVLEGTAEAVVGDDRVDVRAGCVVLVPALVPHSITNKGRDVLRCVAFFSSAAVVHVFEDVIMPVGSRELVTPAPDELSQLGGDEDAAA